MTAKPRVLLGNAHNRITPIDFVQSTNKVCKSKLPKQMSSTSRSRQVKKQLDKEQVEPARTTFPIFRERDFSVNEDFWTLKRANPVYDSEEERDEIESPTKRIRRFAVTDEEDRDDWLGDRVDGNRVLYAHQRLLETDDGYVLSVAEPC
mmetsp:Transcript_12724/g.21627  ORF Transcript_12724/g.21627 Transcript_12724/m.21627 type:complete len:149 (+) Transcript_12724:67-513(+)